MGDNISEVSLPKNTTNLKLPINQEITPQDRKHKCFQAPIQEKSTLTVENEQAETSAQTAKIKRFMKPTVEEVQAYCEARNSSVDPIAFWNFYESKGWVVGKSPMKNWHSAIATWERHTKQEQAAKPSSVEQYNRTMDIAKRLDEMGSTGNLFGGTPNT